MRVRGYIIRVLLVAGAYAITGRAGALLAFSQTPVTAVWPPSGIALAALLMAGPRLWPAVAIGAVAATVLTGGPWTLAPWIAAGATLEALAAAGWLRLVGFRNDLGRVRDVLALGLAGASCATLAAAVGTATLHVHGRMPWASLGGTFTTWWVGDLLGILLVAPVLLTWHASAQLSRRPWRSMEAAVLLAAMLILSWVSFSARVPAGFLLAPLLTWIALRFGQRGATTAVLMVSAVAIWFTVRGIGPFATTSLREGLLTLQMFAGVGSLTTMFLAATATERDRTQDELRVARDELEEKVVERTARLSAANAQLADELAERQRAEEERHTLEARVLQSQKLESLGLLAGGIAHDFNNLLTAILGHAELALDALPPAAPIRRNLDEIGRASRRAAELSGQMLAYSGRVQFVTAPLDLSRLVRDMLPLLEASISKKAQLAWTPGDRLPAVEADPTQLRQIVMNLIINASEAIGERNGTINVCTGAVEGAQLAPSDAWLGEPPGEGRFAFLEVSDTGCGMDDDTRSKIFDPFFTTKFTGRGLGLATVLGIVRGHKGHVQVRSVQGRGTTFTILFPTSARAAAEHDGDTAMDAQAWRGEGTVLVVDDEESVRGLARAMVERCGFTAVVAGDGEEAVRTFRAHQGRFACVLLDMSMPRMGGQETLRELRRIRHDTPVILSSGYPEQDALQSPDARARTSFIQKPYRLAALAEKLREATA